METSIRTSDEAPAPMSADNLASSETDAGLELVRRAVVGGENPAWQALQDYFGAYVVDWCRRSGGDEANLDQLVQATWVEFRQNYTPAKFAGAMSPSHVRQYLKLCARSVVLDAARRHQETIRRDSDFAVAHRHPSLDEDVFHARDRAALWRLVGAQVSDERERVLEHLTYELGLSSAEICAHRPELFPTVRDVSRVTHTMLDQLR